MQETRQVWSLPSLTEQILQQTVEIKNKSSKLLKYTFLTKTQMGKMRRQQVKEIGDVGLSAPAVP